MIRSIEHCLVRADEACDFIPFLSTVNNLVDLVQKGKMALLHMQEVISNNYYYSYLDQKNTLRCIVLLIPIFGNIAVSIYDRRKHDSEELMLEELMKNPENLTKASPRLKGDRDFMLKAVAINVKAMEHATEELKDDRDFMLKAVREKPQAMEYASNRLKADHAFKLEAKGVQPNSWSFMYAACFCPNLA